MIGDLAFAVVLMLAAPLGLIVARSAGPSARNMFALAAVLYTALAVAEIVAILTPGTDALAQSVMLAVAPVAQAALALCVFASFEHPPKAWVAALLLVASLAAGLVAAIIDSAALSFAVLMAAVCAMLALSVRRYATDHHAALHVIVSGLCALAAISASLADDAAGRMGLMLFLAAALLGVSLAVARRSDAAVAEPPGKDLRLVIGAGR